MRTTKLISFFSIILVAGVIVSLYAFKGGDKDALHKRTFYINLTEIKESTGPAKKTILDEIEFKDGKVFSEYFYERYSYKWMRYRINRDSAYVDSTDTKVRQLDVEASYTDEATNQTLTMLFTIVEWDLEGTIRMTKNDKLKKHFDVVGFEKGGKPPKEKKKKKNPNDTIPLFQLKKE